MGGKSHTAGGATAVGDTSPVWVPWATLRPTQGAIGYVQVQEKTTSYLALDPEKRRSFVGEQAIKVVRGPSDSLHVVDHHHWARAWFDMGFPEAPVCIAEDFSALSEDTFLESMAERGWLHPFDPCGHEYPVSSLPESIGAMPDDVYQSIAAFLRMAGVYENPDGFNAKFAWADFMRQRVAPRPPTVDGFSLMLAEAFAAARSSEARGLPGFIASEESGW